jgi:hypothetical protein
MMAGRAHRDERIVVGSGHHRIRCGHRAADAAHHGLPGTRRHRGVAIDIDHAAGGGDMAEFADIMFAMTQCDRIEIAFRRFAAHQRLESIVRQHLADRAQPVGAFRVPRWREVVEACGMRQIECHAKSWRYETRRVKRPI